MSYEQKIINYFEKNYKKIGDDCAYINKTKQLISSDTLVENKHFDLKHFTPQNIAHRLFLSNYSDIQSSGGVSKYVLLNISFPNKNYKFVQQIITNFHRICLRNKVEIIGGDTTSSEKIFLSLTIISDKINNTKIIKRSNAKIDDKIYTFSGIGYSKLGYLSLYSKFKLPNNLKKLSVKQFLKPKMYIYQDIFKHLNITSCMDLSDSLLSTLETISLKSKKKIKLNNLNSVNSKLCKFFEEEKYISLILSSGEEYVPVFTSPKNLLYLNKKKLLIERGIRIICIGSVEKGKGVNLKKFNLAKVKKFDPFKNYYSL